MAPDPSQDVGSAASADEVVGVGHGGSSNVGNGVHAGKHLCIFISPGYLSAGYYRALKGVFQKYPP